MSRIDNSNDRLNFDAGNIVYIIFRHSQKKSVLKLVELQNVVAKYCTKSLLKYSNFVCICIAHEKAYRISGENMQPTFPCVIQIYIKFANFV